MKTISGRSTLEDIGRKIVDSTVYVGIMNRDGVVMFYQAIDPTPAGHPRSFGEMDYKALKITFDRDSIVIE